MRTVLAVLVALSAMLPVACAQREPTPTPTPTLVPTPTPTPALPSSAPRIAVASNVDGDFEIYLIDPDGSNLAQLTDNSATDVDPVWSPDGRKIAFQSDQDGNSQIYVMNADGSNVTRLTYLTVPAFLIAQPTWSPDGSKIAFYLGDPFELHSMNADGSGMVNLNMPTIEPLVSWSPAVPP